MAISLSENGNWHNYIIYEKNNDDDYSAFTKADGATCYIHDVKKKVTKMGGTDILVYIDLHL